jgi:hypothetical protein
VQRVELEPDRTKPLARFPRVRVAVLERVRHEERALHRAQELADLVRARVEPSAPVHARAADQEEADHAAALLRQPDRASTTAATLSSSSARTLSTALGSGAEYRPSPLANAHPAIATPASPSPAT